METDRINGMIMKTEPIEARDMLYKFAEMRGWNKNKLIGWSEAADFADWFANQSSPKIKQLEWVEVNDCGEIGIEAKTPFCNYEVYEYEISNCSGFVLWWYEPYPYVFDTEMQAKMYAQTDFEKRVKECLL